ncbi:MAG: NYN domain-containing protein [bacterium]
MKTAVFIDGAYLERVLKDEFGTPRIDFHLLVTALAGSDPILRTYYYNCLPYQSKQSNTEEQTRFRKKEQFLEALRKLPRFEVRLGKLAFRGMSDTGQPIFEQKRVDVLFARDLVLLAAKQKIERAIILTGDSDLVPAIQTAKDEGVQVHLVHGQRSQVGDDLWSEADERTQIDQNLICSVLLPSRK